ncbi:hypothetical protein EU528_13415 [Candidatus Thorarchaeota archaeon]|nr:MAG: hypothetical protein EU528_13415 [Candidatus Thorarchaeota archaeon]
MRYGRGGGRGSGRGYGQWPGNGPFRHLPPWERPGWLYGRGSCWSMSYWSGTNPPTIPQVSTATNAQSLQNQKDMLVQQLQSLQAAIDQIETRLKELEKQ